MDPVVGMIIRGALALLFLSAALGKLRDRRTFHGIVLDYRLLPPRRAALVAALLPWIELLLAAGVLAGLAPALAGAAVVLALYGGAMAINLARGRRELDCGCGGPSQQLSGWLLARNAGLAMAALAGLLPAAERTPGVVDLLTVMAAVAGLALLYYTAHRLLAQGPRLRQLAARS